MAALAAVRRGPGPSPSRAPCGRPRVFDLDDLLKSRPRGAHLPHALRRGLVDGHPLGRLPARRLLRQVEPTSQAKFVEFTTVLDPAQMPGQRGTVLPWPYTEGLRLDEAMHPLTLLAVGLYGEALPTRTARPCAWSCPGSTASRAQVDRAHPPRREPAARRPGPARARRVRLLLQREPRRSTPALEPGARAAHRRARAGARHCSFNGYGAEVASLYAGLDLRRSY